MADENDTSNDFDSIADLDGESESTSAGRFDEDDEDLDGESESTSAGRFDEDDEDLDNEAAQDRARRDAFVDDVLGRDRAVRSAFGGGPRIHPASSARGVTPDGTLSFHRDEDGDPVCDVCGSVLAEDEEGRVIHPDDEEHDDDDLDTAPESQG